MYYEVAEVSTERQTGHTYVLAHFWAAEKDAQSGKPPVLTNDFLMQLRSEVAIPVRNEMGLLQRKDGVLVSPTALTERDEEIGFVTSKHEFDVTARIKENIETFISRAEEKGYRGRRVGKFTRVADDPFGVIAKVDRAALKGDPGDRVQRGR